MRSFDCENIECVAKGRYNDVQIDAASPNDMKSYCTYIPTINVIEVCVTLIADY